jgi:streptogramin lyase
LVKEADVAARAEGTERAFPAHAADSDALHARNAGPGEQARRELKEWNLPTKWSMPYQAKADRNGDIWTGGMASDRITRINSKTSAMIEYQLPVNTNIRNIFIDDRTTLVTLWFGNNHGAAIVKLEPLD